MGYRHSRSDYTSGSSTGATASSRRSSIRSSRCSSNTSTAVAKYQTYSQIKCGVRKANPAAIVLWAFHQIPSNAKGLTSRRVITFLKRHYKSVDNPRKTGKSIGAMLRCAVDFGLLLKRGNKYFLTPPPIKTRK